MVEGKTPAEASGSDTRQLAVRAIGLGVALSVTMAAVLAAMGRVPWCACGSPTPWAGDIWSSHNSQHLVDPYVFTHVMHGVIFYGVFRGALGKDRLIPRFGAALVLEAAWEILENTPMVINRYREATISLDYFGDSILNSVGDLWACALGFWIARRLPWQASVALYLATELLLVWWIRDSLTLNVIMLVYPLDAIRDWQAALAP